MHEVLQQAWQETGEALAGPHYHHGSRHHGYNNGHSCERRHTHHEHSSHSRKEIKARRMHKSADE
jgi:hypothetical protein